MIPENDLTEHKLVYSRGMHGGVWRIIGYFSEPSVTLQNIITKERASCGIYSLNAQEFEPINGLESGDGVDPIKVVKQP